MGRLDGKVALVTGVTSGIGRAVFDLFAAEGASVVGLGRRAELGESIAESIREWGGNAHFVRADVSRRSDVAAAVSRAIDLHGGLDVVVNNAAVGVYHKTVLDTTEDEWDEILAINLKSVYLVSYHALHHLRERGGGSIVNVSSVHAYATTEGVAAYAASKGGILALSRQMALDYARDRIRVNALVVGAVETEMLHKHASAEGRTFDEMGWSTNDREIGRVGQPIEIAKAALFLASEDSSFVNGAPLIVDGGLLARL